MQKNKLELIDQDSYYRAFKQWLNLSNNYYDSNNEDDMNDNWLKFADEVGIYLGGKVEKEKIPAEIIDASCWRQAKAHYSIISYKTLDTEV
jgi:hypothetical protein